MYDFIPGQRCISDAELQMGLGTILTVEFRTITVLFLATGETRTYARQSAPLTRVEFAVGDTISSHDGVSIRVSEVLENNGLLTYIGVDSSDRSIEMEESLLDNFLQLNRPSERLFNGQIDQDKWFELRFQTLAQRNRLAHSELYGLTGCRTSLIPHQLYIAHEVARRYAPRVLLADEVGLGKTIEAGLILHRQMLTGHAHRVLIVVPESLLHQWLVEMLRRFNLHFKIFDDERWQSLAEDSEAGNLFHTEQLVLCSLEFLADHPDVYALSLHGEWDLLIVDEAHHLEWSPGHASDEYRMVEELARATEGVLLLTATPEQLGKEGHFARLRLLDPDRFPDFHKFVEEENEYEPIAQVVEDLLNDKSLNECDISVIRSTFNEGDNEHALDELQNTDIGSEANQLARIDLVEHLLDRHGTGRVLFRNTRAAVKGFPERQVFDYPLPLPVEYEACLKGKAIPTASLLTPEVIYPSGSTNRPWTEIDPRINWLTEKLTELHPGKVLVIASTAHTALDITQHIKLQTGLHAVVFHEGLSIVERDRAAAGFADLETGAQVLVCSEIGSEGRNFQFAHHIVLFDLPLNPDLLEQRIGRLDRIGQTDTIRIHVPYLRNSAQSVMFRWYQEGLAAFEHTCPAGHAVYTRLENELHAALQDSSSSIENLLQQAASIHSELTESLHRGRDRLLEYNSCRMHIAQALKELAHEADHSSVLHDYMENVYDCFGVDTELHSKNCLIIRPTEHMINRFPGLSDDGMTVTYDRDTALSFEDAQYITWEHPMVEGVMDMVTSNENGNTSVTAISYKGAQPGTVLLECLYSLEAAPVEALQVDRYLPPTTIRVVIDEKGLDHSNRLPHRFIANSRKHVDIETGNKIVRAKQKVLKKLVDRCEQVAQAQVPAVLKEAQQHSSDTLMREINRLKALRQVNPNVRQEEISFFEQRLELLNEILLSASLRLDALRVIVAT